MNKFTKVVFYIILLYGVNTLYKSYRIERDYQAMQQAWKTEDAAKTDRANIFEGIPNSKIYRF